MIYSENNSDTELQNQTPKAGGSNLLEHLHNTVTTPDAMPLTRYSVHKCRCNCWFCPDCCEVMGYKLRAKLIPILETFGGLLMVSLTIDPELFPDPKSAYLYLMDNRCISVTIQDLYRQKHLKTRRYFYVVEWQVKTEMAHFHTLLDSTYIPFDILLLVWSKHRPDSAGPVVGNRPAFGTVIFSAPKFASPVHAARYATKYLVKMPTQGFPGWVLDMGDDRRIRRYSTSRGFWGTHSQRSNNPTKTRENKRQTYAQKLQTCGQAINVMENAVVIDRQTGEAKVSPQWVGQIKAPASDVLPKLYDPGNPDRGNRILLARNLGEVEKVIESTTGQPVEWNRRRAYGVGGLTCEKN
jgi:hypothetical protein